MRLYFERHDGNAVTCEDFVRAMADASGRDLGQFMRWYGQAGTPELKVTRSYDPERQALTLEISQSTPATPGQRREAALPPADPPGPDRPATARRSRCSSTGENEPKGTERVLELTEAAQSFTFLGLDAEPVPSLLRGFSAPVKLDAGYDDDELARLMAHDSDAFTRWDAGQRLAGQRAAGSWSRDHAAGRAAGRARPATGRGLRRQPGPCAGGPGLRRAGAVAAGQRLSRPADGGDRRRGAAPRARPCPRASSARPCATAGSRPTARTATRGRSRSTPPPWAGGR